METRTHNEIPFMKVILSVLLFLFMITGAERSPAQPAANQRPGAKTVANTVDIVRDPTDVPPPVGNRAPAVVHVTLSARRCSVNWIHPLAPLTATGRSTERCLAP